MATERIALKNIEKWDFAQSMLQLEMMKLENISGLSGYLYYPSGIAMFLGLSLMITMVLF
jgi:hypothetical protein